MVFTGIGSSRELSIGEFLQSRARDATGQRLAIDVSVGLSAIIVAVALRPGLWLLLASAGVCLASFGLWAATKRLPSVGVRSLGQTRLISAIGLVFSAAAVIGAIATALFLWIALMGTWTL